MLNSNTNSKNPLSDPTSTHWSDPVFCSNQIMIKMDAGGLFYAWKENLSRPHEHECDVLLAKYSSTRHLT